MSTARAATIQRIEDILGLFDDQDPKRNVAIALANTIYPVITDPKQLLGVPEGTILAVAAYGGYRPLLWEGGKLHGKLPGIADYASPETVIGRWGDSLTVVWMP